MDVETTFQKPGMHRSMLRIHKIEKIQKIELKLKAYLLILGTLMLKMNSVNVNWESRLQTCSITSWKAF